MLANVYEEIQPKLFTFFYMKTMNVATAEDLTQDVFYEATRSIHRFNGNSSLSTWLFAIAHHLLKKYYRSKNYTQALASQIAEEFKMTPLSTEQVTELKVFNELAHKLIRDLSEPISEIILLRLYGELSFKEIADIIGKTENYTRVMFHRAKRQLRVELEGYE